jgi:hypothetical protein
MKEGNQEIPKTPNYKFIYYFYFIFSLYQFWIYKSYPLNRNLVLEICKEMVYNYVVTEHMHKQKSQHDA